MECISRKKNIAEKGDRNNKVTSLFLDLSVPEISGVKSISKFSFGESFNYLLLLISNNLY